MAFTILLVVSRGGPTTAGSAVDVIMSDTCAGERHGVAASISATVPVTSGVAMLVPLHVPYAPGALIELVIATPGPYTSTHEPLLLQLAGVAVASTAATVMAVGTRAGEYRHAS